MAFSDTQRRALQRAVPARNIRTRKLNGREFPYIEGWFAIAEANRIFGLDGWDRETIESRCIVGREIRGAFLAIYSAKVRITVRTEGAVVVREGSGSGEARGSSLGEAHEIALKAAETDGTKRALATFGKPFGLALYLSRRLPDQNHQSRPHTNDQAPALSSGLAARDGIPSGSRQLEATQRAEVPSTMLSSMTHAHANLLPTSPVEAVPVAREPVSIPQGPAPQKTSDNDFGAVVPARIDKSVLTFGEPRRERDKHHLLWVGTQPCLICGRAPSDAHHLRFAQSRMIGKKVGDQFTVPLCREHHRQLHECSDESAWWTDLEIDAIEIAKGLWEQSRAKRAALVRSLPGSADPLAKARS